MREIIKKLPVLIAIALLSVSVLLKIITIILYSD